MLNKIINQLTENKDTKWYFDSVEKIDNQYHLNGWIYSTLGNVIKIYADDFELEYSTVSRPDVGLAMNSKSIELGVKFKLPVEKRNSKISAMILEVDGSQVMVELGSLLKWITYYSGFKREHKDLIVVDNFYEDPDLIREFTMHSMEFSHSGYHKGQRTFDRFWVEGTQEKLEKIIGRKITNWHNPNYANGVFQYCIAQDPIVYHIDPQTYAAMVFLTPDAPLETGTAFYKSKVTGATVFEGPHDTLEFQKTFKGISNDLNFYDSTQYELMDEVANVYNRLVLFNAKRIHAATKYFGDSKENSRFFQLFFFDVV
jgi:hypothetical protein